MTNKDNLIPAFTELAKLQINLGTKGGPQEDSELFEKILENQLNILKRFGLPETPDNITIISFTQLPTEMEIEKRIKLLNKKATDFLLSPIMTDLQFLKDSKERKLDAFEVLPRLHFSGHIYNTFIYQNILLTGKDNADNVLEALNKANDLQILNLLGIVALCKNFGEEEKQMLNLLNSKGIKYLDEYISAYQLEHKDEEHIQSHLAEFWSDLNYGYEFKSHDEKFWAISYSLMNFLCLVVAGHPYRIVECEVYYNDKNHPDPYSHKRDEQLEAGRWYFNDFGLDLTFGDKSKNIYASFLIRGIRSLVNKDRYISGPSKVMREIFHQFGNVLQDNGGIFLAELNQDLISEIDCIDRFCQAKRIGLTKQKEDTENFIEKPYRFIAVEKNPKQKFTDKEAIVKQLLIDSKISKEDVKSILGYNFK